MRNLGMEAIQPSQATELSSKIISIYELLLDSSLDIPLPALLQVDRQEHQPTVFRYRHP